MTFCLSHLVIQLWGLIDILDLDIVNSSFMGCPGVTIGMEPDLGIV